jgi:hypothetical protein
MRTATALGVLAGFTSLAFLAVCNDGLAFCGGVRRGFLPVPIASSGHCGEHGKQPHHG